MLTIPECQVKDTTQQGENMKGIFNKALLFIAVLLLTTPLVLTGCASKDPVTADILKNSMTAMAKVSSYKAALDLTMDMTVTDNDGTQKATIDMNGTVVADVQKKNAKTNMDISTSIPVLGKQQATMQTYVVDGWEYISSSLLGSADTWNKMKLPTTVNQDQVSQLTALMKTSITSTLQGSDTVNGIDCYALKVDPDMTALWKWLSSQQGGSLTSGIDFSKVDISKIIKDFGLKYWVAKKGYQIVKVEAQINMNIDASDLGADFGASGSMTMLMNMDMTLSEFNKAVSIVLPAEAQNAKEIKTP